MSEQLNGREISKWHRRGGLADGHTVDHSTSAIIMQHANNTEGEEEEKKGKEGRRHGRLITRTIGAAACVSLSLSTAAVISLPSDLSIASLPLLSPHLSSWICSSLVL